MQKPSLEDGFLYLTLAAEDAAWTASHVGTKSVELTSNEVRNNYQYTCTYSEVEGEYGTVSVDNNLVATHTPSVADASDVLDIVGGDLVVTQSPRGGTADYYLEDGVLKVNRGFTGSITAIADFNPEAQYKVINFYYDHNGLRTRKVVWDHGVTETYDYTLHGKLITHMTKRREDEEGNVSNQELHFFYDSQSKPAFVEFEGERYRYVHSLQGDIIAIVDVDGNVMVKYGYDVWGRASFVEDVSNISLSVLNPFRYRSYVWDEDNNLYYLRSRYYDSKMSRFVSPDMVAAEATSIMSSVRNLYTYCYNEANNHADDEGALGFFATLALGGLLNVAASVISSFVNGDSYGWGDAAYDFGMGMVTTFAGMMGGVGGRVVSGVVAAAADGLNYMIEAKDEYSNKECALRMVYGFASTVAAPELATSYVDELMGVARADSDVVGLVYSSASSSINAYYTKRREERKADKKPEWTDGAKYITKRIYDPLSGRVREVVVFI